jgi:hypothetical protein
MPCPRGGRTTCSCRLLTLKNWRSRGPWMRSSAVSTEFIDGRINSIFTEYGMRRTNAHTYFEQAVHMLLTEKCSLLSIFKLSISRAHRRGFFHILIVHRIYNPLNSFPPRYWGASNSGDNLRVLDCRASKFIGVNADPSSNIANTFSIS